MDSYEFNKIAGAVLGTLVFLMGLGIVSNAIFSVKPPEKSAYALPEPVTDAGPAEPAEPETPLPVLLAKADPKRGATITQSACAACHTFEKDGATRQGPNLYAIIGREIASVSGYTYSDGLRKAAAEHKVWSFDAMAAFITNPRQFAPGNRMAYAGLRNRERLADMLAYLASVGDVPAPLPELAPADVPAAPPVGIDPAPANGNGAAPQQPGQEPGQAPEQTPGGQQ